MATDYGPTIRPSPARAGAALGLSVALPLLGVALAGETPAAFLSFPPEGRERSYPGFSWAAFAGIWTLFAALVAAWRFAPRASSPANPPPTTEDGGRPGNRRHGFPAWGWAGPALCLVFWLAAWLPGESLLRRYAFPPLWVGYILTVNALIHLRTGNCPLARERSRFLALFPASAAFWWLFEYLNRFVNNWVYLAPSDPGVGEYVLHASLSFATVLPAVYSTRALLGTFPALRRALARGPRLPRARERATGAAFFLLGALGMAGIGWRPDHLFPVLWLGPLLLWCGLETLGGRPPWAETRRGDWRDVVSWALAALVCGFFWEMWNFHAMPKWIYQIPWFERFYLFEMPVSGYLGYLPFGLECALGVALVRRLAGNGPEGPPPIPEAES